QDAERAASSLMAVIVARHVVASGQLDLEVIGDGAEDAVFQKTAAGALCGETGLGPQRIRTACSRGGFHVETPYRILARMLVEACSAVSKPSKGLPTMASRMSSGSSSNVMAT